MSEPISCYIRRYTFYSYYNVRQLNGKLHLVFLFELRCLPQVCVFIFPSIEKPNFQTEKECSVAALSFHHREFNRNSISSTSQTYRFVKYSRKIMVLLDTQRKVRRRTNNATSCRSDQNWSLLLGFSHESLKYTSIVINVYKLSDFSNLSWSESKFEIVERSMLSLLLLFEFIIFFFLVFPRLLLRYT